MIRASTPGGSRRQLRRAAKLAEILDVALAIVIDEGIGALKMPRLAEDVGLAVGGLYRYFPSKQALVGALQIRAVEAFGAFLAGRMRGDPLARIVAATEAWSAFADAEPALFLLVDRALSDPRPVLDDVAAREVDAAIRRALAPLVQALDDAAAAGLLSRGDAEVRAHALWAAVHGVRHFHKRDRILPARLHAAAIRREMIAAILRGWGPAME